MASILYPNHDQVKTEEPPPFNSATSLILVDYTLTFMNVPENSGEDRELPVDDSVDTVPNVQEITELAADLGVHTVATHDTHISGKNATVVTSYDNTIVPYRSYSLDEVYNWGGKDNNPILPTAGFTLDQYTRYLEIIDAHKATIWPRHADPLSRFYGIYPSVLSTLMKNPNLEIVRKGSHMSEIIPGFVPEAYSALFTALGESLGLGESLKARKKRIIFTYGLARDFCVGFTNLDLARMGFEVWCIIDAGASVFVSPENTGTQWNSDQLMVMREIEAGVHYCKTADVIRVNGRRRRQRAA